MHSEEDAGGEEQPCDQRPDARDLDPLFAGVAHHERAESKGEGNGEAHVAQVKHGRVNDHLRILEEGIEAVAVVGNCALQQRKWRGGKVQDREEEDLDAGHDGAGVGVELDVGFVGEAEDEAVNAEQPGPEKQGAFLAAPQGGELVGAGEGAVGVLQDVGDGKVVGEDGPDEGEGGGGDGEEADNAGAAGGIGQALGGNARRLPGGDQTQCERSSEQIVRG